MWGCTFDGFFVAFQGLQQFNRACKVLVHARWEGKEGGAPCWSSALLRALKSADRSCARPQLRLQLEYAFRPTSATCRGGNCKYGCKYACVIRGVLLSCVDQPIRALLCYSQPLGASTIGWCWQLPPFREITPAPP